MKQLYTPPRRLTGPMLRARLGGVSDMTLWRWLHDEKLAFPKPLVINRRRYWDEAEIIAWERAQTDLSAA